MRIASSLVGLAEAFVVHVRTEQRRPRKTMGLSLKMKPPGIGPQVVFVHVSIYQGKAFWGYPIFDPQPCVSRKRGETSDESCCDFRLESPGNSSFLEGGEGSRRLGLCFLVWVGKRVPVLAKARANWGKAREFEDAFLFCR